MENKKNVSDIAYANPRSNPVAWDKSFIHDMIEKLGEKETINRWAFQLELPNKDAKILIDQYLNDDWIDEKGIKTGQDFWGDL